MGGFRELSAEELNLVSGGYYVPGVGWIIDGPGGDGGGGGGGGGSWDTGSGGGGGGGAGSSPPPLTPCEERAVDNNAWSVRQQIQATPDMGTSFEYGAIIYRDADGSIKTSAFQSQGSEEEIELRISGSVGYGNILGIVHNHGILLNNSTDYLNQAPSPNDWATFDNLIAHGAQADQLRTYIMGPDGHLRQYDSTSIRGTVSTDEVVGLQYC